MTNVSKVICHNVLDDMPSFTTANNYSQKHDLFSHFLGDCARMGFLCGFQSLKNLCKNGSCFFLSFAEATKTAEEQVPSATGLDGGRGDIYIYFPLLFEGECDMPIKLGIFRIFNTPSPKD